MRNDFPWTLWREFLERAHDRATNDVEHRLRTLDLPSHLVNEVRESLRESLESHFRSEIVESRRNEWGEWLRSEQRNSDRQLQLQESVARLERGLYKRLADIESRLDAVDKPCWYAPVDEVSRTASYITSLPAEIGTKTQADPNTFMQKLGEVARTGRVLTLVDPYALSEVNDSGDKGNCIKQIVELSKMGSIEKLHLYSRSDAVNADVWEMLEKQLTASKLSVHLGDIHDRYLLAGSDSSKGAGFDSPWHSYAHWKGVVFGSSLNGVRKRPTYVLKFEQGDVHEIRRYLDDHTKPMTLTTFKEVRAARDAQQDREVTGARGQRT